MDQFDWLVGGGNGSSSSSGGGGSGSGSGGSGDDWLHLSNLMLEGLDEDNDCDDADIAMRAAAAGVSLAPSNLNSNNNNEQHATTIHHQQSNTMNQMTPTATNGGAGSSQQHQQQQSNIFHPASIADIAIATQQAILASSLLANHHYLASLTQTNTGGQQNPLTPLSLLANPFLAQQALPALVTAQQQQAQASVAAPASGITNTRASTAGSSSTAAAAASKPEKTETEMDKRRRNTEASARFRAKKKMKQEEMELAARQLSNRVDLVERRVYEYESEIQMLRRALAGDGSTDNPRLRQIYEDNGIPFSQPLHNQPFDMFGERRMSLGGGIERRNSSGTFGLGDEHKHESLTDMLGLDAPSSSRFAGVSLPPIGLHTAEFGGSVVSGSVDGRSESPASATAPLSNKRQRKK